MIAGGVAVNLYGIERATHDVDMVIKLSPDNVEKFIHVAKELCLTPRVPVPIDAFADENKRKEWMEEKNMLVFTLLDRGNPFFALDVFVETPFDFDMVYARRMKMKFEGIEVSVVSVKDLIMMKNGTDRPQDKADVYYLSQIAKEWENEKVKK